ncbi:MAG: type II toxin-antitoxin system RelE/ParE family toxin [Bradymonadales bacterium]|nr:MAG: type II toxin-antitoxin system RelE/ParE family toxin [Bradymonadales bacterium]
MYQIEYLERVLEDDIPSLPKSIGLKIRRVIEERLTLDPVAFGKPLRYGLKGSRRLRVGDYRIIFVIEEGARTVLITKIGHRKEIYG